MPLQTKPIQDDYWKDWQEYDETAIKQILRLKTPFVRQALFNLQERTIITACGVPQKRWKDYFVVGESHYHASCNQGGTLLVGLLAYSGDEEFKRYISPEAFEEARDKSMFHKAQINKLKFTRACNITGAYPLRLTLLNTLQASGTLYLKIGVKDCLEGTLLYTYSPNGLKML